jgi:hypothetical protein
VFIDDIIVIDLHKGHIVIAIPSKFYPLPQSIQNILIGTWNLLDCLLYFGSIASQVKDIPEGGVDLGLYN